MTLNAIHHSFHDASIFPTNRPLLAIITETDACDTEDKMNHTYEAIRQAVSTNQVDLVSVRVSLPPAKQFNNKESDDAHLILERACTLTEKLVQLSLEQKILECTGDAPPISSIRVVCSSDLVSVAVRARAHGIHFKEHHLDQLPEILQRFDYPIVIGTSTHSVKSALQSYFGRDETSDQIPRPDYYFVGTCYLTASHPEKTSADQLEGPKLPGEVKRAILSKCQSQQSPLRVPRILAIGGIDECNCHNPVAFGADGVAVIRAVLQAADPSKKVEEIQANMTKALDFAH